MRLLRPHGPLGCLFVAALLWTGCDTSSADTAAAAAADANAAGLGDGNPYADLPPTFDAVLNEVSLQHPGFKGAVANDDGHGLVALVAPGEGLNPTRLLADLAAAVSPPGTRSAGGGAAPGREVSVRLVEDSDRPDFHVLYRAKTQLRRFFARRGTIVSLDLDEVRGRVVVGTASEARAATVRARMTDDELAVTDFIRAEPVSLLRGARSARQPGLLNQPSRSIRNSLFSPLVGGVEAKLVLPNGTPDECSVGPIVKYNNSTYGFLTAAHCTMNRAQVTSFQFYHPNISTLVGTEIAEAPFRSGWFITDGYYSDVAFVKTPPGTTLRGRVIFAEGCNLNSQECREISESDISGSTSYLGVGSYANKTGRSTGTTSGRIAQTCVDIEGDDGRRNLCANRVAHAPDEPYPSTLPLADSGDSGSIVHTYSLPMGTQDVIGVLWGRPSTTTFYYSPWENIWQQERAGTNYGLPVTVVTASQGVVSNTSGGGGGGGGGCLTPTGLVPEPC